MIAVDTNLIVRMMTRDDEAQYAAALAVFASGPVWIAKTVLVETAWVLLKAYRFENSQVTTALEGLIALENVHVEDDEAVAAALELTRFNVAFADALHVMSRPAGSSFVSFDRQLVKSAKQAGIGKVSLPSTR